MNALERLKARIAASRDGDPARSYTASLIARGPKRIAQKLGEEAVEAAIAIVAGDRQSLIAESADLIYHLLVAWEAAGIAPDEVWAELARREAMSGIEEKASRGAG